MNLSLSFNTVKSVVTSVAGRSGLVLQKYSPEILLGAGLTGMVLSTVLACKATLKVEGVLAESNETINKINDTYERAANPEDTAIDQTSYTDKDKQKDLILAHVQRAVNIGRLYAPAIGLGVFSVAAILASHGLMAKRNTALAAAYAVMQRGYDQYRKNVVRELGPEKDIELATTEYETEEVPNDGPNKDKEPVVLRQVKKMHLPEYAQWFKEGNIWYQRNDPAHNMFTLQMQQNWANDQLRSKGYLFLNDVYVCLGLPATDYGQLVGWYYENSSSVVDFGLNKYNPTWEDFRTGKRADIMLIFNVDSRPVYNRI